MPTVQEKQGENKIENKTNITRSLTDRLNKEENTRNVRNNLIGASVEINKRIYSKRISCLNCTKKNKHKIDSETCENVKY